MPLIEKEEPRKVAAHAIPIPKATDILQANNWCASSVTPAPATIALTNAIMLATVVK